MEILSPRVAHQKRARSAFIGLSEIFLRSEAVQLLADRLDHLQEIRCVCRFWSMASPKAGNKGAAARTVPARCWLSCSRSL